MSGQFQSFDGRDNRRSLMELFVRLGQGFPKQVAARRRARFLRSLIPQSVSCFAQLPLKISPCSAVEAYHLTVAITGVLGVPIDVAASRLERLVRAGR